MNEWVWSIEGIIRSEKTTIWREKKSLSHFHIVYHKSHIVRPAIYPPRVSAVRKQRPTAWAFTRTGRATFPFNSPHINIIQRNLSIKTPPDGWLFVPETCFALCKSRKRRDASTFLVFLWLSFASKESVECGVLSYWTCNVTLSTRTLRDEGSGRCVCWRASVRVCRMR